MDDKNRKQAELVFDTFCAALDKDGWKYDQNRDELTIRAVAQGDDLPMRVHVRLDPSMQLIYLRSTLLNIPEGKRTEAARAICAVNYKIMNGCFDYDEEDGEVTFRLVNSYRGSIIGEELCQYIIMCSCITIDEYNDALALYALGGLNLQEFLKRIGG